MVRRYVSCVAVAAAIAGSALACSTDQTSGGPAKPPPPPDAANANQGPPPDCKLLAGRLGAGHSTAPAGDLGATAIQSRLDDVKELDAPGFAARYGVSFVTDLGYDPAKAKGLEKIQASSLALTPMEQKVLAACGFVMTNRKSFPNFTYGYASVYNEDLPVYVTADSILYAVHNAYSSIFGQVETQALAPLLSRLLSSMQSALASGAASDLPATARQDVDLYLSVAASLLAGHFVPPVAGGNATTARSLFDRAQAAAGRETVALFGADRDTDFSQFTPRGRYTATPAASAYFRAMMWLGRMDLRLIEPVDGAVEFRRRELDAAYALRAAMDTAALADWQRFETTLGAFVGEPDHMIVPQLDALLADLHLERAADLATIPDGVIEKAIIDGGYGAQRIASQIMHEGLGTKEVPLARSFLLLGQRYVVDSHVFSNVTFDRVQKTAAAPRMMPDPLDVGFAVFGNDQAGALLDADLTMHAYASDLAAMRVLVDAHPSSYWETNLYSGWLAMLRALSPATDQSNPTSIGLPRVAGTEPWGRRILSTQLASWAELRHDTILYAKQSYTSDSSCEYPDAYVDPYPEFYTRLASYAARGLELIEPLAMPPFVKDRIIGYFTRVRTIGSTLAIMATNQRQGAPQSAEHMAFINKLLFVAGCGPTHAHGWYADLFLEPADSGNFDPIIADVHTQPSEYGGAPVGKVLHVATGMPREMVVTIDSCAGPRAYVGPVASYFEEVTRDFERKTDEQWAAKIQRGNPADVPWLRAIVAR